MSQIKLIESKRIFDLDDHESISFVVHSAPEPGDDPEAIMAEAIDKMEATATRKYGAAILKKKRESV